METRLAPSIPKSGETHSQARCHWVSEVGRDSSLIPAPHSSDLQDTTILAQFSCGDSLSRSISLLASPAPPSYEETAAAAFDPTAAVKLEEPSTYRQRRRSTVHPRVADLLGVNAHYNWPLLLCRAFSTAPALWWGLRCALTFLGELLLRDGSMPMDEVWSVEKRFRVTEVFLAILWCLASAYLSYFFTDCLMSRWLLHYTPSATLVRLCTTNALIALATNWVLYLSGASEDPRMLLPAWLSITTTLTGLYHLMQRKINIKKETSASVSVFSIAGFVSLCSLLLQLHLTRENDPVVPFFVFLRMAWNSLLHVIDWAMVANKKR